MLAVSILVLLFREGTLVGTSFTLYASRSPKVGLAAGGAPAAGCGGIAGAQSAAEVKAERRHQAEKEHMARLIALEKESYNFG